MLPELCLLPREIGDFAASEPLCAPADERARVESGPRAGTYLARYLHGNNVGRAIVARRESPVSPLIYVHQAQTLGMDIAHKINLQMFNRLLYFDADYRLISERGNWNYELAIHRGDRGEVNWSSRAGGAVNVRRDDCGTHWRCPVDWKFDTPDEQIERDINAMLRDENSYFAIAQSWNFSSEEQQARRLARFAQGDFDAFMRCLRNLVLSFDELDPSAERTLNSRIYQQNNDGSEANRLVLMLMDTHLTSGDERHRIAGLQAQTFEAIARYFRPHWNLELHDLLVRHEIRSGKEINFPVQIIVPAASAHQRLEARLQLRDWLRDEVGARELAVLLEKR